MQNPKNRMILAVLAALCLQAPWAQAKDEFPLVERFIKKGDMAGYEKAAAAFLKAHPDSELAPRVAFDFFMLAKLNGKMPVAEELETKLLMDYPDTLQGGYFRTTYADAKSYREKLGKLLDQYIQSPSADFPKKYRRVLAMGSKQFGNGLFDDNDFILKSALVVAAAGDGEWEQSLLAYFRGRAKKDDELQPIAALAADEAKPLQDRIVGLHGESENKTAGLLRDLLMLRLGEAEKSSPRMRQINAEALLDQKNFTAALAILEKLPTDLDGDKILYQRLWCHAVAGDAKRAADLQARLEQEFPASPWGKSGRQLVGAAQNAGKNLSLYADTLRSLVGTAKQSDEFEASVTYENQKLGKNNKVYFAYAGAAKRFEIQFRQGDVLKIAFKSTASESQFFNEDDKSIRRFMDAGYIFSPNVDVKRDPDGKFNLNGGIGFHKFGKTGNCCLESPYLNDPDSIRSWIQYSLHNGMLLGDVAESPEGRMFRLLGPKPLKPEIEEMRILVSNDNRLKSVQSKSVNLIVRYGQPNSVNFTPMPWPQLQVVTEEKFNPSYLFSVMGKLIGSFMQ